MAGSDDEKQKRDFIKSLPEEHDDTLLENIEVKPQIQYGISVFFPTSGKPHVQITGTPSLLELQMLLGPALANIEGDITANKAAELVVSKLVQLRTAKPTSIITKP